MPSPRPSRTPATLSDGREWRPKRVKAETLPRRARQLVELCVLGDPDNPEAGPLTLEQASAKMNIQARTTGRQYQNNPRALAYRNQLLVEVRAGALPKSLHAAISIRDDGEMKKSAAGNRARIEAMRYLGGAADERRPDPADPSRPVTPGVVVQVNIDRKGVEIDDTVILVNPVGVPEAETSP